MSAPPCGSGAPPPPAARPSCRCDEGQRRAAAAASRPPTPDARTNASRASGQPPSAASSAPEQEPALERAPRGSGSPPPRARRPQPLLGGARSRGPRPAGSGPSAAWRGAGRRRQWTHSGEGRAGSTGDSPHRTGDSTVEPGARRGPVAGVAGARRLGDEELQAGARLRRRGRAATAGRPGPGASPLARVEGHRPRPVRAAPLHPAVLGVHQPSELWARASVGVRRERRVERGAGARAVAGHRRTVPSVRGPWRSGIRLARPAERREGLRGAPGAAPGRGRG